MMKYVHISLATVLIALLAACASPPPVSTSEVVVVSRNRLPVDPTDPAWEGAPSHLAELLLQDMVEPRLLRASTTHVRIGAITDGQRVAFRLRWEDATRNDLPGPGRFSDACAIQLPRGMVTDIPAPQMGEEGSPVEITFWRASWQAAVDGRPDAISALYPGASVDHYPFQAASLVPGSPEEKTLVNQYAPARALDHLMEGPRDRAVEDLLATGPGTLRPAPGQNSQGKGRRAQDAWEVVILRDLPQGLTPGRRSQIAFAIWDGEREEVGARKMRSGWIPLHVETEG